ncbi:MAG: glycoside hydrolase family 2 protein [Lachnospiraceae bacterium]|nr:glycoside hydrolase family 2 protein [Lachnospiraceae bacterium]
MNQRIYLNRDWRFRETFQEEDCNTAMRDGEIVQIPHTVKETPFHYFDESLYQMVACYQKELDIPAEWKDKELRLTFEAVGHEADVYLNGTHICSHHNGYNAFSVYLNQDLRYGEKNQLTVKVNSKEDINQPPFGFVIDYMTYGGIYRDVYLDVVEKAHIQDAFYMPEVEDTIDTGFMTKNQIKNLSVKGALHTKLKLQIPEEQYKITDVTIRQTLDGKVIYDGQVPTDDVLHVELADLAVWDILSPKRYLVETKLCYQGEELDCHSFLIGFRKMEFKSEGFYLNGRKVKLRGLNRHQSYPYVGYAMPESMQRLDAQILKKELGLNAVRTSHYPQSHYFIDECDKLGLLVFTEFPGWQHIGDAAWKDIAVHNVQEMVEEYRNHPSIMLWGVRINESVDDDAFYERTNALARKLDPTRPTGGVRCNEKMHLLEDVYTYNDFSHNGSTPGCKPKAKVTPDTKKAYFISEYNGHMYPTKMFDWEEHRMEHTLRHARVLNEVALQKDIAGSFGWCMFDYNTHKDFGSGDRICYHGVMDMFRNPKMAAAIYAAQSDEEAVLEVTSSMDIGEHPASVRGETYMITNADSVRMYKNDQFIKEYKPDKELFPGLSHPPMVVDDYIGDAMKEGEGYSDHVNTLVKTCLNETAIHGYRISAKVASAAARLVLFHRFKWQDAVNLFQKYVGDWGGSAKVYKFEAVKNGEVVKTVVKAAETKVCLKAKVSHHNLQEKTSYDVAAVRIVAEDEWGNQLPFYGEALRVTVDGPLDIIGPKTTVFRGGATGFYLRTKGVEGKATVTCEAENAEPVTLQFEVES